MKRTFIILAFCLILICTAAFADGADTAVLQSTMKVSISAVCPDENHVGSNWSSTYTMNGVQIENNSEVTLYAGQEITVESTVVENDKYPDIGTNQTTHTVTEEDLINGFSIDHAVQVEENAGRYAGYVCIWNIVYQFGKSGTDPSGSGQPEEEKPGEEKKAADLNGLINADGLWYLYADGEVQTGYSGLYFDQNYGWWLIRNGEIAADYTGLWSDPAYGWWLISGGRLCQEYTGLWEDPQYGWWLIQNGTIAFGYTGLWEDPSLGWWLIGDGRLCQEYTGLWNDPNLGWWLIDHGSLASYYTGLWNDPQYGWWLIGGGRLCDDYTGLWNDPNLGWWLINGGSIAFDYTGLWNDPTYGWWLISNGTIAFDYTGYWNDPVYGTWPVTNGAMDRGCSGEWIMQGVTAGDEFYDSATLGLRITMLLNPDGTGIMTSNEEAGDISWRLEGDQLVLFDGVSYRTGYITADNIFVDSGNGIMMFTR